MGTTTNNGWPTPVATDLVKDGWEAIKDLGDAIDTTLGVYAPSTPGLTLINTTSFSAVASQSVNNVFSATYDYYRILVSFTTTTNGDPMSMRLRLSGTDNSGANTYKTQEIEANSTTIDGTRRSGDNFLLGAGSNVADSVCTSVIDLFNVSLASPTGFQTQNFSALSNGFIRDVKGFHTVSTAFDGFTFITFSGTMSGKLRVYGYNN
jgi:hypothetical protein